MATVASAILKVEYPTTDGEPMAETPVHRQVMADVIDMLQAHFASQSDVYVSGNMMMYYVEGNAAKWVSPDVFVTKGIPMVPEREIYQLWREKKGPNVVVDVTSTSTARVDQRWKFELYRDVLKVPEYFLFDPREKTLAGTSLCGYRLIDGEYELITPIDGRIPSDELGLDLEVSGTELRLFDPRRGVYLQSPKEVRAALERESAARLAAEAQARREADARRAAEIEAKREADARLAAEAETQRLKLELDSLRRRTAQGT
jgi:Uma2 family endonuclease